MTVNDDISSAPLVVRLAGFLTTAPVVTETVVSKMIVVVLILRIFGQSTGRSIFPPVLAIWLRSLRLFVATVVPRSTRFQFPPIFAVNLVSHWVSYAVLFCLYRTLACPVSIHKLGQALKHQ